MRATITLAVSVLAIGSASAGVVDQGTFPVSVNVSAAQCSELSADISGSGQGRFVSHATLDGSGSIHVGFTSSAHGTASAGDGRGYVFSDVDNRTFSGPATGYEVTVIENFHLVGRGAAPDVAVSGVFHLRVSPDGTVKVLVNEVRGNEDCH